MHPISSVRQQRLRAGPWCCHFQQRYTSPNAYCTLSMCHIHSKCFPVFSPHSRWVPFHRGGKEGTKVRQFVLPGRTASERWSCDPNPSSALCSSATHDTKCVSAGVRVTVTCNLIKSMNWWAKSVKISTVSVETKLKPSKTWWQWVTLKTVAGLDVSKEVITDWEKFIKMWINFADCFKCAI